MYYENDDKKKVWNKYYLHFNINSNDRNEILELCDKYNLLGIDDIENIFCYDNINNNDLEIIKKLSL